MDASDLSRRGPPRALHAAAAEKEKPP